MWRAIDGNIVYDKDYIAYQDSSGYYRYFHDVGDSRWYIPRLRFGKINLFFYVRERLGHGTDVRGPFHVFIFGKDDSKMQTLVYNDFYNAIKDYPPAAQKLKELYPDSKISRFHDEENLRNFIEIVKLYNK